MVRPGRWLLNTVGTPNLITRVDARVKGCDWIIFHLPDRFTPGAKWVVSTTDRGKPAINDFFNTSSCSRYLLFDLSELPPIDIESIPLEYQELIEEVYGEDWSASMMQP